MRSLLGGLLLAAAAWAGTASAGVEVPVIENAGYNYCVDEAVDALRVGRLPAVFGRTRAQLEADPQMSPYLRDLLAAYFADKEAGKSPSYAHFALHRFQGCLTAQKVKLDARYTGDWIFSCLTRMDIPYFYLVLKSAGVGREEAIAKVETTLAGWHYPPGLVPLLAEPSWMVGQDSDLRNLQGFVFNSCLLPQDMVAEHYGVQLPLDGKARPPAAGPHKAPGAPAK